MTDCNVILKLIKSGPIIIYKGATITLPGGGGGAGFKIYIYSGPGFGPKKILALTMCEKIFWLHPLNKKSALYP